jgi:hypothetical protein
MDRVAGPGPAPALRNCAGYCGKQEDIALALPQLETATVPMSVIVWQHLQLHNDWGS